jgi:hypothetical protein
LYIGMYNTWHLKKNAQSIGDISINKPILKLYLH